MRFFTIYKIQYLLIGILFFPIISFSQDSSLIYSAHWYGNKPFSNEQNKEILLIHDLFTASFDLDKKYSRWVAYQLNPHFLWGFLQEERNFKNDKLLQENHLKGVGLSIEDYKGAGKFKYDKGHLAPLGSFKGSAFSYQLQYLSNIVPQQANLNRGPWKTLESKVRDFVKKGNELRVVAGVLYGDNNYGKAYRKPLAPWQKINGKVSQLPSGFWKSVSFKGNGVIKICSFIMPQEILNRRVSFQTYIVTREVLQEHTGLALFQGVKNAVKENCEFLN